VFTASSAFMGCIVASASAASPAIRWDKRIPRFP
jgi:hypothetical protein